MTDDTVKKSVLNSFLIIKEIGDWCGTFHGLHHPLKFNKANYTIEKRKNVN